MSSGAAPRVTCPQCQSPLKVMGVAAGEKLTCPKCGTTFQVPSLGNVSGAKQAALNLDDDLFGGVPATPPAPKSTTSRPASPSAATPAPPQPPTRPAANSPIQSRPIAKPSIPPATSPRQAGDEDDFQLAPEEPRAMPPGMPPAIGPKKVPVASSADRYDFSFPCPVCSSQLDSSNEFIGKTIKCDDCETVVTIPKPDPSQIRARGAQVDGSFNLSDAIERPIATNMQANEPFRAHADQMLAKAEKELRAETAKQKRTIGERDLRSVLGFFVQPAAILRIVMLSIGGAVVVGLLGTALGYLLHDKTMIQGFFIGAPGALLGIYWLSLLSASGLVVLNGASGNFGEELPWPELSPLDLFGQALPVFNALLYSWMPAVLIGFLAGSTGNPVAATRSTICVGLFGMVAIFPIVLLSTLHEESLFAPLSKAILKSFGVGRTYWMTFYQVAGLLAILAGAAMLFQYAVGTLGPIVLGPAIVILSLLYFRLLGWLVWRCGEALADEESEEDAE